MGEEHLTDLPKAEMWIWTDGSAEGGVRNGGGGAVIMLLNGDTREVVATGSLCSSTGAELFALRAALEELVSIGDRDASL